MASSRQMRRTNSNTLQPPTTDYGPPISTSDSYLSPDPAHYDVWEEPTIRNPVPSFEDHKGYERHGVLEHMQPLGTMPSAKVKARLRQHEAPRRTGQLRNGDRPSREEVLTPDPLSSNPATHPLPYYGDFSTVQQSLQYLDNAPSYDDKLVTNGAPLVQALANPLTRQRSFEAAPMLPSPASQSQVSLPMSPVPRTSAAQSKHIVDRAIEKSDDLGRFALSLALQKLYEEALNNQTYLDLLHAFLFGHATSDQQNMFDSFLVSAKKEAKRAHPNLKRHTRSSSSSSQKKPSSSNAIRPSENSPDAGQPIRMSRTSTRFLRDTPSKPPSAKMANGSPSKSEPAKKKVKRSESTSTDSSLSSVNSDIEKFAPSNIDPALTQPQTKQAASQNAGAQLVPGSRQAPLSTKRPHADDGTPEAKLAARKRSLQGRHPTSFRESALRSPIAPLRNPKPSTSAGSRGTPQEQRRETRALRSAANDPDDSSDSPLSSQDEDVPPPPPPYHVRGVTPQLGRPAKGGKKTPRIKQSPLKKRGGVTAGLALSTESEAPPVQQGRNEETIAEAEVCCACSGNGSLILCDGCPRGFHLTCCDPPLNPEIELEDLPEQWFCQRCKSSSISKDDTRNSVGLWKDLRKQMQSQNPKAFRLPKGIRYYFEGVTTGEEGEYEDLPNVKLSKARAGYEENPDSLKLKDRKDGTILCSRCGGSTNGKREIVPCDYCTLHWHLDCLDPPLANAPNRKPLNGKPRQAWMCPNHVDQELLNMKASKVDGKFTTRKAAAPQLEESVRVFRTRKPKHPNIVDIGLGRGSRNYGLIEIAGDPSEEESEIEREMSGVIYRIPERAIKLDFIHRVKKSNFEARFHERHLQKLNARRKSRHIQTARLPATVGQDSQGDFDDRPFRERQAALNLQQLAYGTGELDSDVVKNLIQTLTAEAPPHVESLVTSAEAGVVSAEPTGNGPIDTIDEQERHDLETLIKLAQQRLATSNT